MLPGPGEMLALTATFHVCLLPYRLAEPLCSALTDITHSLKINVIGMLKGLGSASCRPHIGSIIPMDIPMTLYPEHRYDRHGQLKPPFWLWPIALLLTRSLWLFLMAGVTRQGGSDILALLYPEPRSLYMAMAVDLPAALALLACGGAQSQPWRSWLRRHTQPLLLLSAGGGLLLQLLALHTQQWSFHWASALTLLGNLWALCYLLRSRQLRDYAADRPMPSALH